MKKYIKTFSLIVFLMLSFFMYKTKANASYVGYTTGSVNFRSGPSTSKSTYGQVPKGTAIEVLSLNTTTGGGCGAGWLNVAYSGKTGYMCASYVYVEGNDIFMRPWTTPKKAIIGGAKFIGSSYINAGQYTSYLKKFNVTGNNLYAHQYMGNLRAPYSEAKTSYNAYNSAGILNSALVFSIPVYNNMDDKYPLPGTSFDDTAIDTVEDTAFESKLDKQGFPESYKRRLRYIHKKHPNWTFEAIKTNLDFDDVIDNEMPICVIDGNTTAYRNSTNYSTEKNWYTPNRETTAYFLDPRNFIFNQERILQFEKLYYSDLYTQATVQAVLNGTFMSGKSTLDNQSYASIFVEAGKVNNVNPVYLASLSKQEVGTNGSKATSGAEFTYKGVTYKGLYNFFNIGAYASEESPVLAGLVWGAVGYNSATLVSQTSSSSSSPSTTSKTVASSVKKGDPNGDGVINSADLLKVRQHLLGKNRLSGEYEKAADVDGNGVINSADLLRIRQHLLGTNKIS